MNEQPNSDTPRDPIHGSESGTSFRDRAMARMATERGEEPRIPVSESVRRAGESPDGGDPASGSAEAPSEPPVEALEQVDAPVEEIEDHAEPVAEDAAEADDAVEAGAEEDDLAHLPPEARKLVEEARERELQWRQTMTRKTQQAAEETRAARKAQEENLQQHEELRRISEFNAQVANHRVNVFETQIDWGTLRTQNPDLARQYDQAYQQARQERELLKQRHDEIVKSLTEQRETAKRQEAQFARDVLMSRPEFIDREGGFNVGYFGQMRQYAVEERGWHAEDFDDLTDHRVLSLLADAYQVAKAPKEVRRLTKKRKSPPTARQREKRTALPPRNSQGRFQSERQAFLETGDRSHFRAATLARLQSERGE